MAENIFRRWLQGEGPKPPIGTWLMSGAVSTAEALGYAGMDWLCIDMEHVPIDVPDTLDILRAIANTPAQPVVRLPWNDQVMVKRVLDIGAVNLMFPFVQTPEEAALAVARTRYPPEGVRGVAAMHRASRYGSTQGYLQGANDGLAVIVQIETLEALERLPEIAAVPGVDALFLGPGDLSAAMGRLGDIGNTEVQRMIARAAELARAAGKPIGIVGPNPDMVRRFLAYGYSYVAVGSDLSMMTGRAGEWMGALRGQAADQAQPSGPY